MKEAGQVLRNEKVKTTDEFLVEKKEPLVLPPDYKEIPEPGTLNEKKQSEDFRLKREVLFLNFLKKINYSYCPLIKTCDEKLNFILLSWIEGEKVKRPLKHDFNEFTFFYQKLNFLCEYKRLKNNLIRHFYCLQKPMVHQQTLLKK